MKKKFTFLVILATFLALLFGITKVDSPQAIKKILLEAKPTYLAMILFCLAMYWFLQAMVLRQLFYNRGQSISIGRALKAHMIGEFFSAVTPLSTGGQPMQVMYLSQVGIPAGKSTSVLVIHLFFYHVARLIMGIGLTLLHRSFFYQKGQALTYFLLLGIVINILLAMFMMTAAVRPKQLKKAGRGLLRFLSKIKLLRNVEDRIKRMEREVDGFYRSIKSFRDQQGKIFLMVLVESFVYLVFYFSITYYVFLSFGLELENLSLVLAAQCVISLISAYIPLPGGSFGAEGAFYLIFSRIVGDAAPIFLAILLWRVLTYYVTLIVGSLFTLKLK